MKITLEGKDYTIDTTQALKLGVLKPLIVHKVGNRYTNGHDTYILAAAAFREVHLVNIRTGWTFGTPQKVGDWDNLSNEDWDKVGGEDFKLIK